MVDQQVLSERQLIENVKKGERASFDALVVLYRQKGLHIAFNLVRNLEDAKDVVQEAFIKVYSNIGSFHERAAFSTWFYRIVTNCALDFLRKKKKHRAVSFNATDDQGEQKPLEVPDVSLGPWQQASEREFHDLLFEQINQLSEKQRICFTLKHQSGLSVQEIAQVVQCKPATVKVHLFRATEYLRQRLARFSR
ncbi:MAG: sigma-70 family RNA polymerase sigma factor [Candidatus Omnitrophica bacterium]|nr:sigma-70 family RNA polymerase sigma factor [Candidatus Omnitrophota bacterium]